MLSGTRVQETSTGYFGTVIRCNGETRCNVQFDTVGSIASWAEWIDVDLLAVIN